MFNLIMICAIIYLSISLVSHIINIYKFFTEDKEEDAEKYKLEE